MKEYFARAAALMTAIKMHSTKMPAVAAAAEGEQVQGRGVGREGVGAWQGDTCYDACTTHITKRKQLQIQVRASVCVNGSDVERERESE